MNLWTLVLLPFAGWHLYRAVRALSSGVFESLGRPVERASLAALFWFRVAREFLLGVLFATLLVSLALGMSRASLAWVFGSYVVVYLTLVGATVGGGGKQSNRPLDRPGTHAPRPPDGASAGHSAPGR